ncbi:hypothetical protein ACH5RR_015030 [Cinchona calisaya]|uniref:Uncharacterized protein n=1 Tax=Cinchona calisaya TaxID=153742 RepID=A0ABD2ZRZ6_9GENT
MDFRQVASAAAKVWAHISSLVQQSFPDIWFQEFRKQVKYWITINEPWSFAYGGIYVYNFLAPGLGTVEGKLLCFSYPSPTTELEDDGSSIFPPSRFSFQFFIKKPSLEKSVKIQSHEYSTHSVPYEKISIEDPSKYAYMVGHNQLVAHGKAAKLYKEKY